MGRGDPAPRLVGAGPSQEIELNVWVYPTQPPGVGAQRRPASGPRDVHNMTGAAIENVGREQQLVDLPGGSSVELTEHQGWMSQRFGELRSGVWADRAYLVQRQRR